MPDLGPTAALIALLADVRDHKVLDDPETCGPYLDLPDGAHVDVRTAIWSYERAGWVWLPPDTLVWRLTDRGREVLDRGAP